MPLGHLRVCPCDAVRFAECSPACKLPAASDPESWLPNMQEGAGTIPRGDMR